MDVARIMSLAAEQHGVISVEQLTALGIGRRTVDNLVRRGDLVRCCPRVYAAAGSPDTWARRLRAGLLSLGAEAMVSHEAAARLHGFDRSRAGAVEFTVPRSRRNAAGCGSVHSTAYIGRTDVITVDSLRVTSATRTIVDLARARIAPVRLEAAIDSAVRLGLSSPVVLAERLAELRGRGRWGCRQLDRLLLDSGGHTILERKFLTLMRESDLPRPVTQVIHRRGMRTVARVDFLFPAFGIVVEVSGGHGHSSPAERAQDAQRRNELQDLGRKVYEFTWRDVTGRPKHVVESMRRRLIDAGWRR
jgi:very-short-patch-repair endonuclease